MSHKKGKGMTGKNHTKETMEKISNANKGKKRSKEHKKIISETHKGVKKTEEQKRKMSESAKGRKHSKEQREKQSVSMMGKTSWSKGLTKDTDERLRKMGQKHKGKIVSKETKMKMSKSTKGRKLSAETINKLSGSNSHEWLGGKSFEPYDKRFNNQFRKDMRNRDNQICMLCGIHREKLKQSLSIHHCDYQKLNTTKENCICLCKSCHSKTNKNREEWTIFFQSLLNKLYGYNYLGGKEN